MIFKDRSKCSIISLKDIETLMPWATLFLTLFIESKDSLTLAALSKRFTASLKFAHLSASSITSRFVVSILLNFSPMLRLISLSSCIFWSIFQRARTEKTKNTIVVTVPQRDIASLGASSSMCHIPLV